MRHQNTFACFLFFIERKYQQNVSILLFQLIADKIVSLAKDSFKDVVINDDVLDTTRVESLKRETVR